MSIDKRTLANAIRFLSIDAVQKAKSGHPGMPMGMADIAEVLWNDVIKHNPANPDWFNRDRFVLSNGHGSMLIYSLLHLSGFDLSMEDIKQFRQLHSKTPGHPELTDTPGIETTTGPLGQGLANAVGMAVAEQQLAATFNKDDHNVIDHFTYVFAGDGCLMEGVSHEACSLAGTLGLGKLIVFWDDNGISIDGKVDDWFSDDTPKRFESYGWQVISNVDGHDSKAIRTAIDQAQGDANRPTIICCKTQIAWGSPNLAGTSKAHGAPLGDEEIATVRKNLNWPHAPFEIPSEIYQAWDGCDKGIASEESWQAQFDSYQDKYPELANELTNRIDGQLPEDFEDKSLEYFNSVAQNPVKVATRKASEQCLDFYGPRVPAMFGGSADLTGSNLTRWKGAQTYTPADSSGRYMSYGVREFGMTAIMNGMALHGGFIPFGGTFLVFSDYARNAIRMAALMKQKVAMVLTHDSIGLGEDGPTHQPIEHAASLRLIPGVSVWRPCDDLETAAAWHHAITYQGPTCLLLSRQGLTPQRSHNADMATILKGGYVVYEPSSAPEVILIATGSEVELAVDAAKQLGNARVVSMPSVDCFESQSQAYRDSVLPPAIKKRVVIEAGVGAGWYQYSGDQGKIISIEQFGLSAPAGQVYAEFGLTVDNIVKVAKGLEATCEVME